MLTRRIIPCLDVRDGRVVKGVQFKGLRDMGDPVELAARYGKDGADELCFLNVSASVRGEEMLLDVVERISRVLFIPLTVGGGIRCARDAQVALRAGADKVALNTAALKRPELLTELASEFGCQCVVLSIDTRRQGDRWVVTTHSATQTWQRDCLEWAHEGVERGAGEILLNVIDSDGQRRGFGIDITAKVSQGVSVPVIASGGAGAPEHFVEVFERTAASAALAASVFHDGSWTSMALKQLLSKRGVEVRL